MFKILVEEFDGNLAGSDINYTSAMATQKILEKFLELFLKSNVFILRPDSYSYGILTTVLHDHLAALEV
jgi:hypothetical protein